MDGSELSQVELDGADIDLWQRRFLEDLAVVRSANTMKAYAADLERWVAFCQAVAIHPFQARPRTTIHFVRAESERLQRGKPISPRTIVRALSGIRQWYTYLALEPEQTGVWHNPVPAGSAVRTGAGAISRKPAFLRYDRRLPQVLTADEIDRFVACLTATTYRDRAITWLLKDGGVRIHEALNLQLADINWPKRVITVHATKTGSARLVPLTSEATTLLANYVRLERPKGVAHDYVFVNLGRRGFGERFSYRSWVAICEAARKAANTPRVHAHAFRHTYATNMAESGMPLDALQRVLGHRHIETVMVYNQVRDGRVYREYQEAMAVQEAARRLTAAS